MASDDDEIPETGAIFTFGRTRFAENLANKFWIRDDKVLQLACGDEHSAVLTSSGRLYTFGSNDWGQLGHGNNKSYTKPSVVKKLKGDKVKNVACGRSHTLVISESGVFSFGAGSDSQLGHGDNQNQNIPLEIEALNDKNIKQISCGAEHSAAVTDNGELYLWGSGSEGQLGLGIAECELPSLLKLRAMVINVACGYYHTAVITEHGKLYTFGDNECGQLGLEDHQCDDTEQPQQVKTLNEPLVFVACGGNHTAVISKRGSLFTFGSGMHGQLGHGPSFQQISLPKLVSILQGKCITYVSCGESHTAVVSKDGEMFTFGDGRHGKLGMGDESFSNLFQPTKVVRFKRFCVEQVSCGGCHMLVIAVHRHDDFQDSEGSEHDKVEQDNASGNDIPDGPRLSQTVPISGMSARDKRRKKDTEGVAQTSSLPPLNRSLPPLASLGLSNIKKEDNISIGNGKLNLLNRSTLPVISIKSPSPDDEENSEKLPNSRRLPPRPKRRQKKTIPTSDSEDENDRKQKLNTTPRPTPLPRKQKLKENENADNTEKSRKSGKISTPKSGSEASDEDSEDDESLNETKERKIFKENEKKEDFSGSEEEDNNDSEGHDEKRDKRKQIEKYGKRNEEESVKKNDEGKDLRLKDEENKKKKMKENKGNVSEDEVTEQEREEGVDQEDDEDDEDDQDNQDDDEDDDKDNQDDQDDDDDKVDEDDDKDDDGKKKKRNKKTESDDKDEKNEDSTQSKDQKKGKKKGKSKQEAEDKKNKKEKGKKKKDKCEEEQDKKDDNNEDNEVDNKNEDKNEVKGKDEKNNKTKKSGICILL